MSQETYLPVDCPGPRSGEPCGRYLAKIAFSHHALVAVTCPKCGTQWRIFHHPNNPQVELTAVNRLEDDSETVLKLVTWGRYETPAKMAMA